MIRFSALSLLFVASIASAAPVRLECYGAIQICSHAPDRCQAPEAIRSKSVVEVDETEIRQLDELKFLQIGSCKQDKLSVSCREEAAGGNPERTVRIDRKTGEIRYRADNPAAAEKTSTASHPARLDYWGRCEVKTAPVTSF